jgi:hypothetical protein
MPRSTAETAAENRRNSAADGNPKPVRQPAPTVPHAEPLTAGAAANADNGQENSATAARDARDGRDFQGAYPSPLADIMAFIAAYMILPERYLLVVGAWVIAAWLAEVWDLFPHLAISSPEMRCGKSKLLELLYLIVRSPLLTTNISPAALYRRIQKGLEEEKLPTVLVDESQSISRKGSESSEVMREMLNASISPKVKAVRCAGENRDKIEEFSLYCPKVFALIGNLDGVLADRCLPIPLERKTKEEKTKRARARQRDAEGGAIRQAIEEWVGKVKSKIVEVHGTIELFDIDNDRMADLLIPLQTVLTVLKWYESMPVEGADEPPLIPETRKDTLKMLKEYADGLEQASKEVESHSVGVRLLYACRHLFTNLRKDFMNTDLLISGLVDRKDEPWATYNKGQQPVTREALANMLRPFKIKSEYGLKRSDGKGYWARDFKDAWDRYLPPADTADTASKSPSSPGVCPLKIPTIPSIPSIPGIPADDSRKNGTPPTLKQRPAGMALPAAKA